MLPNEYKNPCAASAILSLKNLKKNLTADFYGL
jgi:hypothetical protein